MQWGAVRQPFASDAVDEGCWSDEDDYIRKSSAPGHSMQYWNPADRKPSPRAWLSRSATIGNANTPVELVSFAAQGVAAGVRLRWRTESETANAGFRILRADSADGPFAPVRDDLIPGQGSTPHATDYEHTDETAEPGTTYHYRLEDVAHDGKTGQSETITAQAGTPAP